jgi:hypothetical protein
VLTQCACHGQKYVETFFGLINWEAAGANFA